MSSLISLLTLAAVVVAVPLQVEERSNNSSNTYCTPGQTCWPTINQWQSFNASLNGKLIQTIPWASPCYAAPGPLNPAQCSTIEKNYTDGFSRASIFGAAELLNWESCGEDKCWLQTTAPQAGPLPNLICGLGRLAPYAVNLSTATAPQDIATTISFSRLHNIKLSIKNTGHEYLGRSTGQNTLAIWTHNLQAIQVNKTSSLSSGGPIMAIGAGVFARDAYQAASDNGYTITLGAYGSVGVGGGFAMGGGHGPLAPKYGLAVDNIVQYSVVTADGKFRHVNANTNPDLLFALRGGGGGTFGVVTEVVYRLHPPTAMQSYNLTFNLVGNPPNDTIDVLTVLASYQNSLSNMGWTGYNFISTSRINFFYHLPSSNVSQALSSFKPIVNYVLANPQKYNVTVNQLYSFKTFQDFVNGVLIPGVSYTPVAYGERLAGRLIPQSLFTTDASRRNLTSTIIQGRQLQLALDPVLAPQSDFQIYATSPNKSISGVDTGVNTAYRSSLWEIVYATAWFDGIPATVKDNAANAVHRAADPVRAITPNGGCYYSEADVLEEDWQTAFFGSNYPRLVSIKKTYDPDNIFTVWKGIGWTGASDPAYSCYNHA